MRDETGAAAGGPTFELLQLCRYFSELSPQPMVAVEGTMHIVRFLNEAFARLVGNKTSELIGRRFADAVPEGANNGCMALLDRVFRTGTSENLAEQQHAQTPPTYWSYTVWTILGLDDQPAGVMIQVTDVTETAIFRRQVTDMNQALVISSVHQHELTELAQRAEAATHESDERFHAMADNIPQLAWMANKDGHIFWYNRRWYDYTGTTLEQMEGWGWQSVHDPDELSKVLERWRESIATGKIFDMVFPLRGKDGEFRPFLTRVAPVKDDKGQVVRWFGTNTDVTEQRQMAEKLRQNAVQMAEADNRKNEFLAMLGHELRNPLAPIANAVHLLRLQRNEDQLQQEARTIIERQLGQLTRLIDELLEISRITTGRIHLQQQRLDLRSILERAKESVGPLMVQHQHVLTVRLPPDPVWLNADATRLEQVLVNLLNNAAKYSDDHSQIWLGLEQEGAEAVLRVHDSGIGIAPDVLPRIFDLFTQAKRTLDRSQGGLGIGLALVKELVTMHGGTVEAISTLGQGSKFVVRLPIADCRLPMEAKADDTNRNSAIENRKSLRVLVVDDNVDAVQSLALLLEGYGHDVRIAYTGPTAVAAASEYNPDIVFLDIGLPELDGFQVAKRIRQQPMHNNTVLVALTGYAQESDRQQSNEAGFDHYLVKPANFGKVLQILAAVSASPSR